jgi:hypothetical protein
VDAEEGDGADRERHRDAEQAPDDRPGAQADGAVELEAGAEEGDDHGELADDLEQVGVVDRIEPADVEQIDDERRADAEAEVDEAGGEGALVLVRERGDRGEEREPEEEQRDGVRSAGGEARLGGEMRGHGGRGTRRVRTSGAVATFS